MRNLKDNTMLIGDFNLPRIDWAAMQREKKVEEFLQTVSEEGLEQLVSFQTHTKGNILDLVLTKNCDVISVKGEGRLGKSDHCIIGVEIGLSSKTGTGNSTRRPDWRKANFRAMREDLEMVDWERELNGDLETMWQKFRNITERLTYQYVPKSTARGPDKPQWLSREIIRLVRSKNRSWKTARLYKNKETIERYENLAKEVEAKIQRAKRNLEKKLARSEDNNGTKFSRYIKSKTKNKTRLKFWFIL